jgi:hypothetical protein
MLMSNSADRLAHKLMSEVLIHKENKLDRGQTRSLVDTSLPVAKYTALCGIFV